MIETNESLKLSLKLIFVANVGFICWSLSDNDMNFEPVWMV